MPLLKLSFAIAIIFAAGCAGVFDRRYSNGTQRIDKRYEADRRYSRCPSSMTMDYSGSCRSQGRARN